MLTSKFQTTLVPRRRIHIVASYAPVSSAEKAYHDIADEDAVPTVESRRTTPGPPPRVTDRAEDTALHPFGSATPMVIRDTRSGSRCSACGRFGHEQGDPECVHAPGARVLPVPMYSPDEHDDEEQASESERQAIRHHCHNLDSNLDFFAASTLLSNPSTSNSNSLHTTYP